MVSTKKRLINFLDRKEKIAAKIKNRRLFVFLDYDGTCTPIVGAPQEAVLSATMRATIQKLARHYAIGIVSGRTIEDVRSKVRIDNIFYAGSHGFEIVDPAGNVLINKDAIRIRSTIDEVHRKLEERLKQVPGATIEHVKFTVSVHYRQVAPHDFPQVKAAVREILKEYSDLRTIMGKKVFVIRPKINWDKGKAVDLILKLLKFNKKRDFAIYVGDDLTDEDAFRSLRGRGAGILVAKEKNRPTKANYFVHDPDEVKKVLEFFIRQDGAANS